MPKTPNYSQTIIYKLVCCDVTIKDCYVGHTTNFIKRKNSHKSKCNNPNAKGYNFLVYQFIRSHGGFDNWSMVEIEKYCCDDKLEAGKRERYWVETLQASLNTVIPSRSRLEYYKDNRFKISQQKKESNLRNKDHIFEYGVKYRELNKEKIRQYKTTPYVCPCGGCYTNTGKSKHSKTNIHQNFLINLAVKEYNYYYEDGSECTEQEYNLYSC